MDNFNFVFQDGRRRVPTHAPPSAGAHGSNPSGDLKLGKIQVAHLYHNITPAFGRECC